MALIGTIRNNSWILVVLIGLGLGAFILMDMSGQSGPGGAVTSYKMGEVDGKELDFQEFQKVEDMLYRGSSADYFARKNQLWNYFVEEAIVTKQADALGLSVNGDELADLQYGANPSPVISNRFRNPQTGVVDVAQLNQVRAQIQSGDISPEYRSFWIHQEKEIIKDRLQSKLNTMVSKALYTPDWMVEQTYGDQTQRIAFDYVRVPFTEVADSEVTLADSDYTSYLNANKGKFMQDEETRKLSYVVLDVIPSATDSAALRKELRDVISNFETAPNDTLFVESYYGTVSGQWLKESSLPENIQTGVSATGVGKVYGPYVQGNTFQLLKVTERKVMADSSTSRHILINATDPASFALADAKIDSIKTVLEAGRGKFEDLAAALSQDPGSKDKGGKYENIPVGQFVPSYNEVMVSGDFGKLYKARTAYGVHLIEPLSRSSESSRYVKIAVINKPIKPSDETQTMVYEKANDLITNSNDLAGLGTAVTQSSDLLSVETSPALKANDFLVGTLGGGNDAREMVKFAFNGSTDAGDVSPKVYAFQTPEGTYTNRYVVTGLKGIQAAGLPSVASVKEELELLVRNQKKGELLKGKVTGSDLAAIASQFDSEVDQATSVTFDSKFTQGLGDEPKVIATAFNMGINSVSQPVVGNNGVYVVKLTDKPSVGTNMNIPQLRKNSSSSAQARVSAGLIQAMKKTADVEDLRSKFY